MRFLGLVIAGLAACAAPASSTPGYLARVGPLPLRFRTPPPAPVPLPNIPAGPSSPESSANSTPATEPGAPPARPSSSLVQLSPDTDASRQPRTPESLPPSQPEPGAGAFIPQTNAPLLVSPQMLLPFFTWPGASNLAAVISVPVDFKPAQPPLPPSSSATYTSPAKR